MNPFKKETVLLSVGMLLVLSVSLIVSLFFKEKWLWMDEVLSYLLISDPSLSHANDALVSGMDANPPLFANVYWAIGHGLSLNTQFLRGVSVVIFAGTIATFFAFITSLMGKPGINFILVTAIVGFTYLNYTLSTQIRAYSLFLAIGCGYFIILARLLASPRQPKWLLALLLAGSLLAFIHNFGLFYLAASGAFFLLVLLWSKDRNYGWVLAVHVVIAGLWLLVWYPSFSIQTEAGKPHSWIPIPTFSSFFATVAELEPTLSAKLEASRFLLFLPVLRFSLLVGVGIYIALPKLKNGFKLIANDTAFLFFLLSGFLYLSTIFMALAVSLLHTSVFISRYLWPSHLLVIYLIVYAFYFFLGQKRLPEFRFSLAVYAVLLGALIVYQNGKSVIFSSGILAYLPKNDPAPIYVETADYFLPMWFHHQSANPRYLLDWQTASRKGNALNATVEYNILKSVREKYATSNIVPVANFTQNRSPYFYVVDEASQYQIEQFIADGTVKVLQIIPVGIPGHRILKCSFSIEK